MSYCSSIPRLASDDLDMEPCTSIFMIIAWSDMTVMNEYYVPNEHFTYQKNNFDEVTSRKGSIIVYLGDLGTN